MNITIQRNKPKGDYTHGHLSIDGLRICDTLENTNGLAPAGVYPITLIKCKQYARKMPLLANLEPCARLCRLARPRTLNFEPCCDKCPKLHCVCHNTLMPCWCPMLKPGNGICGRLDGSILVGQFNCLGCLIHPKTTFDPLYERIRKSLSRGNEVILTISS